MGQEDSPQVLALKEWREKLKADIHEYLTEYKALSSLAGQAIPDKEFTDLQISKILALMQKLNRCLEEN